MLLFFLQSILVLGVGNSEWRQNKLERKGPRNASVAILAQMCFAWKLLSYIWAVEAVAPMLLLEDTAVRWTMQIRQTILRYRTESTSWLLKDEKRKSNKYKQALIGTTTRRILWTTLARCRTLLDQLFIDVVVWLECLTKIFDTFTNIGSVIFEIIR